MFAIEQLRRKAQQQKKTILLPEVDDSRVVAACDIINREGIAQAILVGPGDLDPQKTDEFTREYYEMRKFKGITLEEARATVTLPLYYSAMMTRAGHVDGFVAGASQTSSNVIKAAIHCIGPDERLGTVSSCFIMAVPGCASGDRGAFFFADCGVIPDPSPKQLANIAVSTAELARKVLDFTPRVAMLSYSTKGSAEGPMVEKVNRAVELARQIAPGLIIDGELQVDSALVPEVALKKAPDAIIKGDANVLIFPSLEAGNIGYKLVQRLGNARAVGPILIGLKKPCSDLSRGCIIDDIIDCVAVAAIMAQE